MIMFAISTGMHRIDRNEIYLTILELEECEYLIGILQDCSDPCDIDEMLVCNFGVKNDDVSTRLKFVEFRIRLDVDILQARDSSFED